MRAVRVCEIVFVASFACAAAPAQIIDDFESYADTPSLQAVWGVFATLDTTTPTVGKGTKSLRREGATQGSGFGFFVARDFDPPLDLSGLPGIEVSARRDPASDISTVQFDIAAGDVDGHSCLSQGVPVITDSDWHSTVLSFPDECTFVDLAAIDEITLFVTDKTSGGPGGDLMVNYDHLQVALLQDGFETGDTSRWSAVSP